MTRVADSRQSGIDVGISSLKSQGGDLLFGKYVTVELQELAEFRAYFLGR